MVLIILISVLLCSCSNKAKPHYQENTGDNVTYEPSNTDGINGVYIITEKGPVPIAYTKNGTLPLSGDVYYYNLKNILWNDEAVKQKTFTYFDEFGCNVGKKSYSDFEKDTNDPYKALALTGNWRLCPDMRHIEYDEKSTPPDEYKTLFLSGFDGKITEQNLNITDAWETDLDKDGTNEAVVKAKGDNYVVIILLSETMGKNVLYSHFDGGQNFDARPFFADLDGNGIPSAMILSGDSLKTVCVFKEKTPTVSYCVYLPIV